jgi:predicted ABC-type ATPase
MTERHLVIVGGPNGSGKSTFAEEYGRRYAIDYLGADSIALELSPDDPLSAKVSAGKQFVHRLSAAIAAGESRIVESTLSGKGLERHIAQARQAGFRISVVFVTLDSPELCIARIRERVAQGGHHVPDADVRRRFVRSRYLFWHHYRLTANSWQLFANTGEGFELLATGKDQQVTATDPDQLNLFIESLESL